MRALTILALISTVYGEIPPYQPSGWRPQGQPFTLPSRQQQYGPPPQNQQQQYNTIQFSAPQQLNQQYTAPQNQYGAPQNEYSAPQNQYGAPDLNNQQVQQQQSQNNNNLLAAQQQNQYGAPNINDQYGFGSDSNRQQQQPNQNGASNINDQYGFGSDNNRQQQQQQNNNQLPAQQQNQYGTPQINNQYGFGSVDPLRTQNIPRESPARNFGANNFNSNEQNQNGASRINDQYGFSLDSNRQQQQQNNNNQLAGQQQNQYGAPKLNNQYGVASVDPLRSQNIPRESPARNFGANNFNFNQATPGTTYLSQTPAVNNNENRNQQQFDSSSNPNLNNRQQQSGKLISPNAFASNQNFQNVEPFNQRQNSQNFNQNPLRGREEISDSDELNQDQLDEQSESLNGEEVAADPRREYGTPTTTKRPIKAPKKPERTTAKPRTTTEQPDNDGDFDQPNVAISTAVAGSSTTGQYYILQPDGRLQRVVYMTSPDPKDDKSAAVVANLMYETVEPLAGPIYQYVGSELVRIN